MHFSSTVLILATALSGAAAHPGHRHAHVHMQQRRDIQAREPIVFVTDNQGAPASSENNNNNNNNNNGNDSAPAEKPAAKPAETSPTPSSGGKSLLPKTKKPFCDGAAALHKRATQADIFYAGNVGAPGKWGCNIMEVDCDTLDLYDYGATFTGRGNGPHDVYSCSAFNKIGPDGGVNGFWHSALDFTVNRGETKCLALDKNSQGAVACNSGTGGPELTPIGQKASTWAEFDCGSEVNGGQSGADVSRLVADANGMSYIGMTIEAPGKGICSLMKSDGTCEECYKGGMEDLDGIGCTGYTKGAIKIVLGD